MQIERFELEPQSTQRALRRAFLSLSALCVLCGSNRKEKRTPIFTSTEKKGGAFISHTDPSPVANPVLVSELDHIVSQFCSQGGYKVIVKKILIKLLLIKQRVDLPIWNAEPQY